MKNSPHGKHAFGPRYSQKRPLSRPDSGPRDKFFLDAREFGRLRNLQTRGNVTNVLVRIKVKKYFCCAVGVL